MDEKHRMDESRRRVASECSWECRFHGGAQEVSVPPKGKLFMAKVKAQREEGRIWDEKSGDE